MSLSRLDQILASTGELSRKEAKLAVKAGRVTIDGKTADDPYLKVDACAHRFYLDGRELKYKEFYHVMLNKPAGVLSATRDGRDKTALDLLPDKYKKIGLFPAGRLDKDAEGFLLLTSDGALAHGLMSPRRHVDKVYFVRVEGSLTEEDREAFETGVIINGDYTCLPAKLSIIKSDTVSEAQVTLREGRFHQIKKMFAARNKCVIYLKRISIAGVELDFSLVSGAFRELTPDEEITIYSHTSK